MTSEISRFTLSSKNILTPDEAELYELTQLAGVITDPSVFKIILDLLKLNVAPAAILHMIKSMSGPVKRPKTTTAKHHTIKPTSVPSAQSIRQSRPRDMKK